MEYTRRERAGRNPLSEEDFLEQDLLLLEAENELNQTVPLQNNSCHALSLLLSKPLDPHVQP